jgi:MoxR-like ATPase
MTASDLVGRFLLDKDGTKWQDGPLTTAARIGAICYLDEIVSFWVIKIQATKTLLGRLLKVFH